MELSVMCVPFFKGFFLPPHKLTCGFPCKGGLGRRKRVVGECHAIETSKAGINEIFISPLVDKPLEVAGIVCHEMTHVAAGVKAAHGGAFVAICKHIGLTKGKPTQAMPGQLLDEKLSKLLEKLGPYPHQAIVPMFKNKKEIEKKQIKAKCECGCTISMSRKWADSVGIPTCACGGEMTSTEEESE